MGRAFGAGVAVGVGLAAGSVVLFRLWQRRQAQAGGEDERVVPHGDPGYVQEAVTSLPATRPETPQKEGSKWDLALEALRKSIIRNHPKGFGCELMELKSMAIEGIFLLPVPHLSEYCDSCTSSGVRNKMGLSKDGVMQQEYNQLMGSQDIVLGDIIRKPSGDPVTRAYVRAGPRKQLHFQPKDVRAAIVTCGGLCPGLNNIIQGVVRTLISLYGVSKVIGVRGGYAGFHDANLPPMELTLEAVAGIHHRGGTMLGTGRGSFDLEKTMAFLLKHRINQLYVVGGDGTHRAADKIASELRKTETNIAVCHPRATFPPPSATRRTSPAPA